MEQELRHVGLRVKVVSADGNCAFRAIGDQLEGDSGDQDHTQLRAKALDFMVANRCRERTQAGRVWRRRAGRAAAAHARARVPPCPQRRV